MLTPSQLFAVSRLVMVPSEHLDLATAVSQLEHRICSVSAISIGPSMCDLKAFSFKWKPSQILQNPGVSAHVIHFCTELRKSQFEQSRVVIPPSPLSKSPRAQCLSLLSPCPVQRREGLASSCRRVFGSPTHRRHEVPETPCPHPLPPPARSCAGSFQRFCVEKGARKRAHPHLPEQRLLQAGRGRERWRWGSSSHSEKEGGVRRAIGAGRGREEEEGGTSLLRGKYTTELRGTIIGEKRRTGGEREERERAGATGPQQLQGNNAPCWDVVRSPKAPASFVLNFAAVFESIRIRPRPSNARAADQG